jgi:hypothetical protein
MLETLHESDIAPSIEHSCETPLLPDTAAVLIFVPGRFDVFEFPPSSSTIRGRP